MEKIKNYFKTAFVYFVGNVFSKLIAFFLLPLYTNSLKPEVLGEYDYVITLIGFIAPICFFQIWDAMFRFSFDYDDEQQKEKVISNAYIVSFGGIIVYSLAFFIFKSLADFQFPGLVYAYGLMVAINYLYTYLARVYRKNVLFSASGFVNSLLVAVCNLVLILVFNLGLESLYISAIVGSIVQCSIIGICIKPFSTFSFEHFDKSAIGNMIKFSIPLCVATISYWLLSGLTTVLIVRFLGTAENGLYAIANKFAMIINMVVMIFQYAWNETAYIYNKDGNRYEMYSVATQYIIHYVILAACILMILTKVVFPVVIGPDYQDALQYLPIAIVGVSFNSIAGFLGTIFSTEKETKYIFWTTFIAAVINIILGIILTKSFGLIGAMGALAFSFMMLFITRMSCIKKVLNIRINGKYLVHILLVLITIVAFYVIQNTIIDILLVVLLVIFELFYNKELYSNAIAFIKNRERNI